MGGGKGGSDFDPKGKSDAEVMRFCQSLVAELYRHIGPDTDVPAGDLGVGSREIGYMFGYYKKLRNEWSGVFTGKSYSYGGSLYRPEATGYGLLYFTQEMLKTFFKTDIKGKRVLISGCGNVGSMAAKKAKELGAIVIGMSNTKGCIIDPNGLDIDFIVDLANARRDVMAEYMAKCPKTKFSSVSKDIWKEPCDIALPCATQGEINLDAAKTLKANGCYMVAEGANMPCDLDAIRFFNENNVIFAPGKASNAGGVAVSGLEMSQNAAHTSWTAEKVDDKLQKIMKEIFKNCYKTASKYGETKNLALGANIAGFLKVCDAMLAEGIV